MQKDDKNDSGTDSITRRSALRKAGTVTGIVAGSPIVGSAVADNSVLEGDKFAVNGTEHVRVVFEEDKITTHWKKKAPELEERYDREVIETTEIMDRPDPERDSYPLRETFTEKRPWNTYIAAEDEWTKEFKRAENADEAGVTTHNETDYPYGVWTYKENDGLYESGSPINMISLNSIDDILDSLYTWTCSWQTGYVREYERYAYNTDTYEYEAQHDSAASSTFGTFGRDHIRMWEFGGYTSIQAHVDSNYPHEAVSYLDAERQVADCLEGDDWFVIEDHYDLPNCCPLDHNGQATRVTD